MVDLPQYVPTSRTGPAGAYAAAVSYRARPSAGGMKPVAASAACRSASGMGDAPGTRPRAGDGTLAMADCREAGECFGKRSEEHTSELQSRGHLVCRLLLE